jgi:hypothetical protein
MLKFLIFLINGFEGILMVNQENIYIKIKNKYANSAIYDINLSTNQILIIYDIKTNLTLKIIKNIEFKGENKNYELIYSIPYIHVHPNF